MTAIIKRGRSAQNPREVSPGDFPVAASLEEQLKFLVNYAVLAPSVHNTQPWLFRILDHSIEIHADRSRALAVLDPEDRSLIISCGSAIRLMEFTLDAFGFGFAVSVFPDISQPDLLATITISSEPEEMRPDEELIRAITRRNTIRRGFQDLPLPSGFVEEFQDLGTSESGYLCLVDDKKAEARILTQLQETERHHRTDIRYRRESESWMHPMRERSRDGVPMRPEEPSPTASCWMVDDVSTDATLLMVVTESADTPQAWLETGFHLMQVLLKASRHGVNAAIMNLPFSSDEIRDVISPLTGCKADPILLLRFGRPRRKLITPRRPLVDVLLHPGFRQ